MKDIIGRKKKKIGFINLIQKRVVVFWSVLRGNFLFYFSKIKNLLVLIKNLIFVKAKLSFKNTNRQKWSMEDWLYLFIVAVLVLMMTYPLILKMRTDVPGIGNDNGDSFLFLWNVWWLKKVWIGQGDLFYTNYLFWPSGVSLVFHTYNLFNTIIIAILSLLFGTILSFNIVYLWSLWLAGVFMYVLVRQIWRSKLAGLVAAVIYAFSPYVWAHSLGHFNLVTIWPFPALVFLIINLYKKKKWWIGVLIGFLLSIIFYNDYQYFFYSLLLMVILLVYYHLFSKNKLIFKIFYIWLIAFLTSFLLIFPVFWRSWVVLKQFAPQALLSEVKYWSADLMSFITPSWQHPIWGQKSLEIFQNEFASRTESVMFLGYGVMLLLVISFLFFLFGRKEKKYYLWLFLGLFFGVLCLGPILKIYGKDEFVFNDIKFNIALPYIWLYNFPFWSIARVPARFFVIILMSVAVLVSYVIAKMDRLSLRRFFWRPFFYLVLILVVVDVIVEYAALPLSLQKISIPQVYEQIKKDSREVVVLELPLWWTSGHRSQGQVKTIIQYYQTYHGKRIFNGSVSRVPDALYDSYDQVLGIRCLINSDDLKNCIDDDRDTYWVWKNDLSVEYVVVHKKYYNQDQVDDLKQYLGDKLQLEKWYEDDEEIGYKL